MANRDMFSHLGDLHASEKRKRDESDDGRQDWARRPWTKGIEAGPGHGPHVGVSGKERPVAVQTSNKAGKSKKDVGPQTNPKGAKLESNDTQGRYVITAPDISNDCTFWGGVSAPSLIIRICHSTTSTRIWGEFDLGEYTGNIRQQTKGLPTHENDTIHFLWRGRDKAQGITTFGYANKGSIAFLGAGRIQGKLHLDNVGRFAFTGKRDPERDIAWSKYAPQWKKAYRGVNQRNYDIANRRRWPGARWAGEPEDEPPADSDSDAEGDDPGSDPSDDSEGRESDSESGSNDSDEESDPDEDPDDVEISNDTQGKYNITSPEVARAWGATSKLVLNICHSSTQTRIWGDFDLCEYEGNIRQTTRGLPTRINDTIHFLWRGRERGEGVTTFGYSNKGSITFLGGGRIEGNMYVDTLGGIRFTGERDPERNIMWARYAPQWKKAYRSFNQTNYDIANRNRWRRTGGYGGAEMVERPADSDSD